MKPLNSLTLLFLLLLSLALSQPPSPPKILSNGQPSRGGWEKDRIGAENEIVPFIAGPHNDIFILGSLTGT